MDPRPKPRVALIADTFASDRGGVAKVARLMAHTLSARRISTELFEANRSDGNFGDFPKHSFNGSKLRIALSLLLKRRQFSHVIFDSPNRARLGTLFSRRSTRAMTFIHGTEIWADAMAQPKWIQATIRSNLILSNTHYTARRACETNPGFPMAKVCWLATEENEAPARNFDRPRNPSALIVSRLNKDEDYKGHRELIANWAQVVAAVPDARLEIIGDGNLAPALKQCAAESPAKDNIRFHGRVSQEALEQAYDDATIFVMPSRGEGFGLVYIEAMRYGLPVIASIHDAGQEVVKNGETGLTINLNAPEELPRSLISLLSNPDQAKEFGIAGQKRWEDHFRYNAFEARFSNILAEFLQS